LAGGRLGEVNLASHGFVPFGVDPLYEYENEEEVIASIENVIGPAETKVKELRQR